MYLLKHTPSNFNAIMYKKEEQHQWKELSFKQFCMCVIVIRYTNQLTFGVEPSPV